MNEISIVASFAAGLVSFLSPCILPIIPGFLSYLGGSSVSESHTQRKEIFINSLFFVAGFSLVFSLLGILLNTVLESIAYDAQVWLARLGGLLVIFFGLYLMGLIKIPFLMRQYVISVKLNTGSRYATSFLLGLAFATGWTPCVGPALGAILGLATTQPGSAFGLLISYSLGLGIPFLLVGLFVAPTQKLIIKYGNHIAHINFIFGLVLVVMGILVFFRKLSMIANFELLQYFL
jgi:cytochrome c-type biogenesis protein